MIITYYCPSCGREDTEADPEPVDCMGNLESPPVEMRYPRTCNRCADHERVFGEYP